MTVIAYRSGVMAADSMVSMTDGLHPRDLKLLFEVKLVQRRGHIIGYAGNDLPETDAMMEWFFSDLGATKREPYKGADFTLLVVGPDAYPVVWTQKGVAIPIPKSTPFMAIGSGRDVAMGAMHMGASAVEAVRAAIRWNPGCGAPVRTKRLREVQP